MNILIPGTAHGVNPIICCQLCCDLLLSTSAQLMLETSILNLNTATDFRRTDPFLNPTNSSRSFPQLTLPARLDIQIIEQCESLISTLAFQDSYSKHYKTNSFDSYFRPVPKSVAVCLHLHST